MDFSRQVSNKSSKKLPLPNSLALKDLLVQQMHTSSIVGSPTMSNKKADHQKQDITYFGEADQSFGFIPSSNNKKASSQPTTLLNSYKKIQ